MVFILNQTELKWQNFLLRFHLSKSTVLSSEPVADSLFTLLEALESLGFFLFCYTMRGVCFITNNILLWTRGSWAVSGFGGWCAQLLRSPHNLWVESLLCNGRELSCLILILTASEPSLLPALKPTGSAYEKKSSLIFQFSGRICISIWLPSKSFCCLKDCHISRNWVPCIVLLCHLLSLEMCQQYPLWTACTFLAFSFLYRVYLLLVPCDFREFCLPLMSGVSFPSPVFSEILSWWLLFW